LNCKYHFKNNSVLILVFAFVYRIGTYLLVTKNSEMYCIVWKPG